MTGPDSPCYSTNEPGDGTHHKKRQFDVRKLQERGETPITKNINVVDEQGNSYNATYPKRANGLIKSGRARFVSENTICLVRPPEIKTEAENMTDQAMTSGSTVEYSIPYILRQIAAIQLETAYLNEAIEKLAAMSDGDSGESYSPGNVAGVAKAEALRDVVRCRETTNQQLLRLYEKMYDDLIRQTT